MADPVTAATDAAHSGAGMPQLDITTFPNQIFWLVVTLVVIFTILNRVALPRVSAVLAERQGTLSKDLAAAEEFKARALQAEETYNKALAEARTQAQAIIAQTRAEIAEDLAKASAKADAQIAAKAAESEARIAEIRANAVKSVQEVATQAAGDILGAFGTQADAKALGAAISAKMKG